jgi:hypothetical protein
MKSFLKKSHIAVFTCVFILCCRTSTKNDTSADTTKIDTPHLSIDTVTMNEVLVKNDEPVPLKNVSLHIGVNEILARSKRLNDTAQKLYSVMAMDSVPANEFRYHLFDTLFWGSQVKLLLIGREYIEENIIWAASYDANNNLIDHLRVYYENSEGYIAVTSEIYNNSIILYDQPDEEGEAKQKPSIYKVNEHYKFVKQE